MQSNETDKNARPDLDALIADLREGAADIDGKHAWPSTMSQAVAALAAERDRADRAEAALGELRRRFDDLNRAQTQDLPFARQKLRADAWDEGYAEGQNDLPTYRTVNPYQS